MTVKLQSGVGWLLGLFVLFALWSGGTWAETQVEPIESRLGSADLATGKNIFLQCAACHVAKPGANPTIGPNLWNVVGRKIGAQPGFDYSSSLKNVAGVWDFEKLNRYLFDPKVLAPEGRMPFAGIKSIEERAHLIVYLSTLSDTPVALPADTATQSENAVSAMDDADKWEGLPPGPGREDVYYRCRACHSLMLVKQQGLSRESWDESLEWMVEEQGMSPIEDEEIRNRVLDYLSSHFGLE
jgi:cytochrome c